MKRRSYAALALTAVIGLSGCASDTDRSDPSADPAISTPWWTWSSREAASSSCIFGWDPPAMGPRSG